MLYKNFAASFCRNIQWGRWIDWFSIQLWLSSLPPHWRICHTLEWFPRPFCLLPLADEGGGRCSHHSNRPSHCCTEETLDTQKLLSLALGTDSRLAYDLLWKTHWFPLKSLAFERYAVRIFSVELRVVLGYWLVVLGGSSHRIEIWMVNKSHKDLFLDLSFIRENKLI